MLQLACRGDEVRPDLWSKNKQKKKKEYFLKKAHASHSSQLSSSSPQQSPTPSPPRIFKNSKKTGAGKEIASGGPNTKETAQRRTRTGRALHAAVESRATANIRNHTSTD